MCSLYLQIFISNKSDFSVWSQFDRHNIFKCGGDRVVNHTCFKPHLN
jgi:hypothetical protein